jgi:hypothetical protein
VFYRRGWRQWNISILLITDNRFWWKMKLPQRITRLLMVLLIRWEKSKIKIKWYSIYFLWSFWRPSHHPKWPNLVHKSWFCYFVEIMFNSLIRNTYMLKSIILSWWCQNEDLQWKDINMNRQSTRYEAKSWSARFNRNYRKRMTECVSELSALIHSSMIKIKEWIDSNERTLSGRASVDICERWLNKKWHSGAIHFLIGE